MNVLKRFIGKLLFPRTFKFTNNLKDAFLEAVKETLQFDASVRDLAQTWLAVCPHTYLSELFLESENWNVPFVRALRRISIIDGLIFTLFNGAPKDLLMLIAIWGGKDEIRSILPRISGPSLPLTVGANYQV